MKRQLLGVFFYDEKNKVTKVKTGRKLAMLWIVDSEISSDRGCGVTVKSKVVDAEMVPADIKPGITEFECDWNGNIVKIG